MIENPTTKDLVNLINNESGTCVSLLMRTHQRGRETNQNSIRYGNLIADAVKRVPDSSDNVRNKLQELTRLEKDFEFWQHQSAGFALFVCENFVEKCKLSFAPEELVCVSDQFQVLPIALGCSASGSTTTLALSWDRARLFTCDGHDVSEVNSEDFPVTMKSLVAERDPEEQLQFSTHSAKGRGPSKGGAGATAMYHGHGEGEDKIEADRNAYLTRVGRLVVDQIYNSDQPLVLVATQEVAGHFKSVFEHEIAEVVEVSPDGLADEDLQSQVLEASQELMRVSGAQEVEKLGTALANSAGSTKLDQIVSQAALGRIDTLLVSNPARQFGSYDREAQSVDISEGGQTDLVNFAVRETLNAGGSVIKVSSDDTDFDVAAIYRF